MNSPHFSFGRALWVWCVCLLLLPRLAAAADPVIDLDGDGQHDHVLFDHRAPSVLSVWLSASDTTQVIHSRVPLTHVVMTDLDGDHRPELIARDTDSRLHVWTRTRDRFHRYRPRHAVPFTLNHPPHRTIPDPDSDSAGEITTTSFAPLALVLSASPRAPAPALSIACTSHTAGTRRSFTPADLFPPRPPPTHRSL